MQGWETKEVEAVKKAEPLIRTFSLDEPKPKPGGYLASFADSSSFVTAIQLGARDEHETALALWKSCCKGMARWQPKLEFDAGYQREELGRKIFAYLLNAAREGKLDWNLVRDRMKACLVDFPSICGDASRADSPNAILESLCLAVDAKPAKAGSVEDLLVRWSRMPGRIGSIFGLWRSLDCEKQAKAQELAKQIVLMGHEAVPELERLANDKRFTARESPAFMNSSAQPVSLGELASELLQELRGGLKSAEGLKDADGRIAAAFEYEGRRLKEVHETPLRLLAARYPERLPPLCAEFTRRAPDDLQPFDLAEVIAASALPKEKRVETLVEFAKHGSLEHKRCILQVLAKLDETATVELVLPLLRKLPRDAKGPYWTCPEAAFTHVVMELSDVRVWHDYLAAAKRSVVGMRMEMMNAMNYAYIGDKGRDLRLAFVAAFLDDSEVRDQGRDDEKYDGPCAGFTFEKIKVRNFAAMQAASILELGEEPAEHWDAAQWSKLRGKVRARLLEMKLPALAP